MQQHLEILSQSPIFKGIEKEELNKLLSTKTFQKKSFDKNFITNYKV